MSRQKWKMPQRQAKLAGHTSPAAGQCALPEERRSEAQYWSIRDGFLCGAGAAPGRQVGATVPCEGVAELSPEVSGARPFHPAGHVPSVRPGTLKLGHDSHGCGYATHTNTDNAPPVRQWTRG